MTINELKEALVTIFAEYFSNITIVWSEQKELVKPDGNFLELKLRNYSRPKHIIKESNSEVPVGYYAVTMQLTVQLFTHGGKKTVSVDGVKNKVTVNTALNDLMDFDNFISSDYGVELQSNYDICIDAEGSAQDVSEVVDTNYEYRAYQEYNVTFTTTVKGPAGISRDNWKPTASGGGTKELANKTSPSLDSSEISIEQTE